MTIIVGIDPGYQGALAFLDSNTGQLHVEDMPLVQTAQGKTDLNLFRLGTILRPETDDRCIAVIERVHAMPKQGIASAFRFGEGFGAIRMAVTGHGYEIHYVTPGTWKKYFRLSRNKDVSRGLASERFPAAADLFVRKKDNDRAEAALMALYGKEELLK